MTKTTSKATKAKTTSKVLKTTTTKTKKPASAAKKKGIGLFAPVNLSASLAAICGGKKMTRPEALKKLWAYIKAKKLNDGRILKPDDKLKAVLPVAKVDMLKMAGMVSKHMSK